MYIDISKTNIRIYASRKLTPEEVVNYLYKQYRTVTKAINERLLLLMCDVSEGKKELLKQQGMKLV